jgi:hypothetical protein
VETDVLVSNRDVKTKTAISSYIFFVEKTLVSRDSSVGIAVDYGMDGPGSVPFRGKIFLSP